ncbi:MAG: NAD(P)/FAD-dependent oxidoreductase [Acidimicrobiia bacterium]
MADSVTYVARPPSSAELVIIGGGIVGAATAFYASQQGLRPLVVERRSAVCTLTTPASTGAFRLQFDNREELEMVRESVELFLNFAEMTGQSAYEPGIRHQGYLWLTTTEEGVERQRRLIASQRDWGQDDIELLSGDEVRRRFPFVAGSVLQARFRQQDGFLDPKQVTMGLLAGSGAAVVVGCAVTGFHIQGGRVTGVETQQGMIATGTAVIAAGPFSGVVTATAAVELPVVTVRRHKIVFPELPVVPADAPMIIDEETGAHWRPALHGAYALLTDPSVPPTEPVEDVPPDYGHAFRVLHPDGPTSLARVAPFWREVWEHSGATWLMHSGQYTVTPDHRPLLGSTAIEGLYVNTGYSGHGIMGSPAGSRHLLDVITGRIPEPENPFRLDREFVKREMDLL